MIRYRNKNSFLADPFGIKYNGKRYIVCEEFDYYSATGNIVVGTLIDGEFNKIADLYSDGVHRSYPFPIQFGGRSYFVPEQCATNTVTLYELSDPEHAIPVADLLINFAAMDSTLFQYDGLWWLFASSREDGAGGANLHLFYSEDLFGGYKAHPKNPVVTSLGSARPAGGLFFDSFSRIIRPGQDCRSTYGGAVTFNVINEISVSDYCEKPILSLSGSQRSIAGVHTVNSYGKKESLIDCKSREIRSDALIGRIGRRIRQSIVR